MALILVLLPASLLYSEHAVLPLPAEGSAVSPELLPLRDLSGAQGGTPSSAATPLHAAALAMCS